MKAIKIILGLFLCFILFSVGLVVFKSKSNTSQIAPTVTPPPTATPSEFSMDGLSQRVVADDTGESIDVGDIRVKRTKFLLDSLSGQADETPLNIANAVSNTSQYIENNFGRRISRQQLLEDMRSLYSDPKSEAHKTPFKDAVKLYAVMKYGK